MQHLSIRNQTSTPPSRNERKLSYCVAKPFPPRWVEEYFLEASRNSLSRGLERAVHTSLNKPFPGQICLHWGHGASLSLSVCSQATGQLYIFPHVLDSEGFFFFSKKNLRQKHSKNFMWQLLIATNIPLITPQTSFQSAS